MKVQQISNQPNFNGSIRFVDYVTHAGNVEKLGETLGRKLGDNLTEMDILISQKPYDLFISRPKNLSEFYQVDANVNFDNVLGSDKAKKGMSSMVYENRLDRFPIAAYEAMKSFEKASEYKNLTKPEGLVKMVLRIIKSIIKS